LFGIPPANEIMSGRVAKLRSLRISEERNALALDEKETMSILL
jgi:hypothetical protein